MDIVQFIVDNMVWLIIFGVLILMATVGYMAEKGGKKGEKEKSEPSPKEKEEPEVKIETEIKEEKQVSPVSKQNDAEDILNMPMNESNTSESVENSLATEAPETITSTGEDLTVPLDNASVSTDSSSNVSNAALQSEISSLLEEAEQMGSETPTSSTSESKNNTDLAMNDISSLFGEKKVETDSSMDIWKF